MVCYNVEELRSRYDAFLLGVVVEWDVKPYYTIPWSRGLCGHICYYV